MGTQESLDTLPLRRSGGLLALSIFFGFAAVMSLLAALSLLFPGGLLEPLWRLNPEAGRGLASLGFWAILLMAAVSAACAASAVGIWVRADWGRRLAVGVLTANLIGDLTGALVRQDARTLIGLPIGGLLIAYLLSARVRRQFKPSPH